MKRILVLCVILLAAFPATAPAQGKKTTHVFATQGDHFTLDGKPFKVLSGELHYARIPREYWHARLKLAKAMGLNTIATYVFWNAHEPQPGQYDFSGQYDVAAFIKAAQEEGLYIILRSGPYACAEWDLGGLPAWLLADPKSAQAIRTNDPAFMAPAERWITRLSKEVLPLQIGRGGPIIMTQIENEYGMFGDDHAYISHLRDIYVRLGFTDSLLYTADNWRHIPEGSIPGMFAATNFGIGNHQRGMDNLATARPGQALFVSEYWPGWFDHWGHPHETRPVAPQIADIDYILNRGAGINIYMFHGGTSFGFMAGSSYINDRFEPDVTSYDYDAPLDESGRPTPKYFAYRKELAKFSPAEASPACRLCLMLPRPLPSQPFSSTANRPTSGISCLSRSPALCPPRWRASARTSATFSTAHNSLSRSMATSSLRTSTTSPPSTSTAGWPEPRSIPVSSIAAMQHPMGACRRSPSQPRVPPGSTSWWRTTAASTSTTPCGLKPKASPSS
jgi:beta-galactosidase